MFFATRACLIFADPKNPKNPDRISITPGSRVPDHLLADESVKNQLLAENLIEHYDVAPAKNAASLNESTDSESFWNFDPKALRGVPLDQLNMLAQQHAAKKKIAKPPVFKDMEEALLFLTKDWKPVPDATS